VLITYKVIVKAKKIKGKKKYVIKIIEREIKMNKFLTKLNHIKTKYFKLILNGT